MVTDYSLSELHQVSLVKQLVQTKLLHSSGGTLLHVGQGNPQSMTQAGQQLNSAAEDKSASVDVRPSLQL